ncbi:MAG: M20/M25/M40 family metallo-hydrolase, partial [Phycisphaerae bacterium]
MIEQVLARIDRQKEQHTEAFFELLRIPSISTDPESRADIRKGAQWVERFFREGGFEVELVDTPGHPCVLSDSGPATGDGPTVLVYGHYDVQPVGDESLWHTPAFEPTVRDGLVYARGSADDKGQVLTHLLAAKCFKTVAGRLPIRVKFVIEGEEEIGSVNLKAVIEKHRERLACDYVVLSDTPKYNHDTPAITYGTKGMIYKELTLTGPKQDLHSGSYGGTLTNPGDALA